LSFFPGGAAAATETFRPPPPRGVRVLAGLQANHVNQSSHWSKTAGSRFVAKIVGAASGRVLIHRPTSGDSDTSSCLRLSSRGERARRPHAAPRGLRQRGAPGRAAASPHPSPEAWTRHWQLGVRVETSCESISDPHLQIQALSLWKQPMPGLLSGCSA